MKFRIIENQERKEQGKVEVYEIFYFDEFDNRGPKWKKVIWDEESYLNFVDNNFVATIEAAKIKAETFMEEYIKENGKVVEEFELNG